MFIVHAVRTATAGLHDVALVKLHTHFTRNRLLALGNERLNGLSLGSEPEAVVDELCVFGNEGVAGLLQFAVDDQSLEVLMGGQ